MSEWDSGATIAVSNLAGSHAFREGDLVAGRYHVLEVLGAGAMGTVFRVRDRELGEDVALKLLRAGLADDAVLLERFRREVKLARRVTHPNVARTYDLGFHEGARFLTMELVAGEPVSALVRDGKRPPLPEVLRIGGDIARGLSAAHAAGVIHRDLKPDNAMRSTGFDRRVVLTDFGIARLAEAPHLDDDPTKTAGHIVGTPAYMAPEQFEGGPIDGRTDVHALGALLFELLTGVLPFRGDTLVAVLTARLARDAPDPRTHDPTIPEAVAGLVLRAMARRREDRPDSETMVQAIDGLRGGRGGAPPERALRVGLASMAGSEIVRSQGAKSSVAIAPIEARTAEAWPTDDLAAALADGMSSLQGLRVVPPAVMRDAMARQRADGDGTQGSALQAARALQATWLLDTTVRAERGRARARVRLLDVERGLQLWAAEPIEGADDDTFGLEDRVVGAATEALRVRVRTGAGARGPSDASVRAIYDRALEAAQQRDVPHMREAAATLEGGLATHPGEPWLMALLGATLVRLYGATGGADASLAARAEELSLRALAADPSLGETYHTIALVRAEQGETRAALLALEEALSRAPLLADAHLLLGMFLVESGRVEEGLARLDVAARLDPRNSIVWIERARTHALLCDRATAERAIAEATTIAKVAPYSLLIRLVLWWNDREAAGRIATALEAARTGAAWEAAAPILRSFADGAVFPGASQRFRLVTFDTITSVRNRCRMVEIATEYHSAVGNVDEALGWLEHVEALPFTGLLWMDRCPALECIRHDPRFAKARAVVALRAAELWR